MTSRFLQFHLLTSYPAALLNRDDVGFAKRIVFGDVTRTRISSQCLKRHWRSHQGEHGIQALGEPMSVRSRRTFERMVYGPLVEEGVAEDVASAVTKVLLEEVVGKASDKPLQTSQVTVVGRPEVEYLLGLARDVCNEADGSAKGAQQAAKEAVKKDVKKNLRALKRAAGLDAAMFGRMVTGDILARGDAAVHVAHALTVHGEEAEADYFSAVDDLLGDGANEERGSGHIGTVELTSGLYYQYVVVDVPLLVSNLEGCEAVHWQNADRELGGAVVERLVHTMSTVTPGAKLGSTAPHARALLVLAEVGEAQPRSLANAFLKPVRAGGDLLGNALQKLSSHAKGLDEMYGDAPARACATLPEYGEAVAGLVEKTQSVPEVAIWARKHVES